jgi:hypothetical protein
MPNAAVCLFDRQCDWIFPEWTLSMTPMPISRWIADHEF